MSNSHQPRYRQVADDLRKQILSKKFKSGESLPTELLLCEQYEISRHTVREALRILTDDGLIERRQGAGSIVTDRSAPEFAPPTGDFESILQYARDATFLLLQAVTAGDETLDELGLTGEYRAFIGLRQVANQPPVALNTIYVMSHVAPSDETIDRLRESVSEWIERHHDVWIERVEQRIDSIALTDEDAGKLDVRPGTPALRTTRRYRNAAGNVILLSRSVHPAGRFAYTMTMERKR